MVANRLHFLAKKSGSVYCESKLHFFLLQFPSCFLPGQQFFWSFDELSIYARAPIFTRFSRQSFFNRLFTCPKSQFEYFWLTLYDFCNTLYSSISRVRLCLGIRSIVCTRSCHHCSMKMEFHYMIIVVTAFNIAASALPDYFTHFHTANFLHPRSII